MKRMHRYWLKGALILLLLQAHAAEAAPPHTATLAAGAGNATRGATPSTPGDGPAPAATAKGQRAAIAQAQATPAAPAPKAASAETVPPKDNPAAKTDAESVPLSPLEHPEVQAIGGLLRCPVCQGMPIGESPSEMARAMMRRVRELHAQGKSRAEILQHFVDRYGEWVLLEPRAEGFNWLVWLLPPLALLVGVGGVVVYSRRGRPTDPGANTAEPAGTRRGTKSATSHAHATPVPTDPSPDGDASDPYLSAIREQV